MSAEFLRDLLRLKEFIEKIYFIEEKAFKDYKDTLARVENKYVADSLSSIASETLVHREFYKGILKAIEEFEREKDKVLFKRLEGGGREIKVLYEALYHHLRLEEDMVKKLDDLLARVKDLEEKYPQHRTTLEMLTGFLKNN